jgi:hypothetical protein
VKPNREKIIMQFYVIVEFLIPGFATTLLALYILEKPLYSLFNLHLLDLLKNAFESSETLTIFVLLTIAYPIGILTNFVIYLLLQRWLLLPYARKKALSEWHKAGVDVTKLVQKLLVQSGESETSADNKLKDEILFRIMYAFIFSCNIDRLNSNYLYHEGLQRLSRGLIFTLILAFVLVITNRPHFFEVWLFLLSAFFIIAAFLLKFSVELNEKNIVLFFVTLIQSSIVLEVTTQNSFLSSLTQERKRRYIKK